MESVWQNIKRTLQGCLPDSTYRMWINPLRFEILSDENYNLICPNQFSKNWVETHYGKLIRSQLNQTAGASAQIFFHVANGDGIGTAKTTVGTDREVQLPLPHFIVRSHSGRVLHKDLIFDNFVVGGNNEFAFSASLSMASKKRSAQKSLFLLSNTGMGKTHLTQAVGHHILDRFPSQRVYYMTAEDFSNEMVHAFRYDSLEQFKKKYRTGCDVLLLEDIHYLTGKERTQVELASTLDLLMEADKKIIFSSCVLPTEIPKINNELRSRISCSLISEIDAPGFRTRVRILQKKARRLGQVVPVEVIRYLAESLTEDVRQLESGIIGVTARASLLGVPINLDLAESVVKKIAKRRKTITIDVIKQLVCREFSVTVKDLVSRSRKQQIVRPRQIAMYLARKYTDAPLQAIGKSFNRYHATALHAIGAVERMLKQKQDVYRQVDIISRKLESGDFTIQGQ